MRLALFSHSLRSCWNHGNAHFLRGLVTELVRRGHEVNAYEPESGWSLSNLRREADGEAALREVEAAYPDLSIRTYTEGEDVCDQLAKFDVVIVHEWNDHDLVARIGRAKRKHGFTLLFHDTHHRSITDEASMARYDLRDYDGVLAFGEVVRELYLARGWTKRAYTFHEAADPRVFAPRPGVQPKVDLVWIGNWGDDEREAELQEFLLGPVKRLGLSARVYGVRYPERALRALSDAGIEYRGWLPNHRAPEVFAAARVTVHVPRRPYAEKLRGIPTIRPFEAMACGIPLVSAPWQDSEGLFRAGEEYLVARDGNEAERHLSAVLGSKGLREQLTRAARARIESAHTCSHRADQLLSIVEDVRCAPKAHEVQEVFG